MPPKPPSPMRLTAVAVGIVALFCRAALANAPESPSAEVCESRTINYITHTLPQQCLRTNWSIANAAVAAATSASMHAPVSSETPAPPDDREEQPQQSTQASQESAAGDEAGDNQELATSSFMSFEEWKAEQLKKAEQDPADLAGRKKHETRGEPDPGASNGELDGLGDDGEIDLDFDALSEKVSQMTASTTASTDVGQSDAKSEDAVLYDDGKTQYYRSKDAGKTCKERFSFSSFDAGATVLKTTKGVKNAKAILVENKDTYMLLECRMENKFVIVELSDDILVDTVVLANFEFFSSMIRAFRVSVSDRYPVKMDKWKDLGIFEARNSRDIQPFLIEHPQIWAKYVRIEFLTWYGNEFYCPISLLRVHGNRMLDSWKESEAGHDDDDEAADVPLHLRGAQSLDVAALEASSSSNAPQDAGHVPGRDHVGVSPWHPALAVEKAQETCAAVPRPMTEPAPSAPGLVASSTATLANHVGPVSSDVQPPSAPTARETPQQHTPSSAIPSEPLSASAEAWPNATSASKAASTPGSTGNSSTAADLQRASAVPAAGEKSLSAEPPVAKQVVSKPTPSNPSPPRPPRPPTTTAVPKASASSTAPKNRTSSPMHPTASPTVQESFFKTVTKRLQLLESNTSLSLQYIEDQSRFLQDALLRMEKKQIARVHSFLDTLNNTVLSELRSVRAQYDQIWQSTVIALETQREQSNREIVALSGRLSLLADEVVFQKRMAILQAALLLSCLVLVIFSRAGGVLVSTGVTSSSSSLPSAPASFPPINATVASSYPSSPADSPSRRREPMATALSSSYSYLEGTSPLTPTSDYRRSPSPPSVQVVRDTHSSYFEFDEQGVFTPPRVNRLPVGVDDSLPAERISSDRDAIGYAEGSGYVEAAPARSQPLLRSSLSARIGTARKPLPALPEDPSLSN